MMFHVVVGAAENLTDLRGAASEAIAKSDAPFLRRFLLLSIVAIVAQILATARHAPGGSRRG
ncbi:MAG: hypothetical protein GY847_38960 [Proteobacteria bacterium]|nr:hypothetical protein [Pseudomonadota bacterium]